MAVRRRCLERLYETSSRSGRDFVSFACPSWYAQYVDLDDEVTDDSGYRSTRSGPLPKRVVVVSLTDELDRAVEHVGGWLEAGVQPSAIGILARDQRTVEIVARGLEDRGVPVRQITRSVATAKHAQLMTMHRAKGMEFSHVLIFGVDAAVV